MPGKSPEIKILCVDDNRPMLSLRKSLFESAGYRVLTAADAQQALRIFASEKIDLVITDHYLSGEMTGTALAAQLKRCRPEIPIVWVSGALELPSARDQFDGFVCKTARAQVLFREIERVLKAARTKLARQTPPVGSANPERRQAVSPMPLRKRPKAFTPPAYASRRVCGSKA